LIYISTHRLAYVGACDSFDLILFASQSPKLYFKVKICRYDSPTYLPQLQKSTYDWLRIHSSTGLSTRKKFRWVLSTTASRFCEFDRRFLRSSRPPSHGNWMDRSWHGSPVQIAQVVWLKLALGAYPHSATYSLHNAFITQLLVGGSSNTILTRLAPLCREALTLVTGGFLIVVLQWCRSQWLENDHGRSLHPSRDPMRTDHFISWWHAKAKYSFLILPSNSDQISITTVRSDHVWHRYSDTGLSCMVLELVDLC